MPKLGTIVQGLLDRAGIKLEDSQAAELANVTLELPDEVAQGFQKNLFTLEDAKKDATVKAHFTGTALSSVDSKFAEALEELGVSDEVKAQLLGVKSTYEKPKAFAEAIKKLQEEKHAATGSKEKQQLQKEIDELKAKFEANGKEWEGKLTAEQQKAKDTIKSFMKKQIIANNELTDAIDKDILVDTVLQGVDRMLREKGAAETLNEFNELKLVDATDAQLPFRMDNKDVAYPDLVKQYLAEKKLIKVSGAPAPPANPLHVPSTDKPNPADQILGGRSNFYQEQIATFQTN